MSQEHTRWTEIKVAMLVHVPFFSSLLFDMMDVKIGKFPEVFGGMTPTAATDGRRIWVDEDFLTSLNLPEAVFLMCHEIGHAMWMHMARAKHYKDMGFEGEPFDARRWNYAGDYVINDMLKESQVGAMIKGGLWDARYPHTMQVDDVYRALKDQMPPPPPSGSGIDPHDSGNDSGTSDVHIHSPAPISETEMKRAVQTALDQAKATGKCPAALERYATKFLTPVVRWQDRLRYHVTRAVSRDATTWNKPHRRRLVLQNVYLPSYTGFGAGDVVVAIDTSGSVTEAELNRFFSELDEILVTCNPTGVALLGCDAAIGATFHLTPGESLRGQKLDLKGGGGTDFRPVFNWVDETGYQPSALIYFTDMYGTFPDEEPAYPVIWCRTSSHDAPWGEVIDVKVTGDDA